MRRALSSLATALAGIALVVPVAVASTPSAASTKATTPAANAWRAVSRRVCDAPAPGHYACLAWIRTNGAGLTAISAATPPAGSLGAADFHTAYNMPATTPVPETIAIVDAFRNPNVVSDLNTYNAQFGLPAFPTCTTAGQTACIAVLNQNGATAPLPAEDLGWGIEIDLDVQAAHAMCQNCRINLYEANSNNNTDLDIAENTAVAQGAQIVSNSFGSLGECNDPAFNHPNVAVIASSGDSGFGRQCPAIMNTVVSVGGTTLPRTPTGFGPETVWSGTGSGCALNIAAQAWQTAEATFAATGCGTHRGSNDVSAVANPQTGAAVFDSRPDPMFPGGPPLNWIQVGGTSLSAPLIAGVYGLGHSASTWTVAAQSVYASSGGFTDVTSGTNPPCNPAFQCTATAGYDLPTGVGTPSGLAGFGASTTDTNKPTITSAPALGLIVPSVLGKASTRIAWTATDGTGLGVAGYRLQHSIDGGVTWIGDGQTTATSKSVSLVIGTQVRYRVNAIDFAANTSPFAVGGPITPQLRQDSAATITYTGTWQTATQAAASGGGVHFTTALNASASAAFTGRAVELVTAVGPGRGMVAVSIDGGAATTINLAAATLTWKAIRFGRLLATNGPHTITIRNTTGGKRVDLDAILFYQ